MKSTCSNTFLVVYNIISIYTGKSKMLTLFKYKHITTTDSNPEMDARASVVPFLAVDGD
jgi:hypothetical protein